MGVSVPERADGWNGVGNKGVASVAARGVVVAGEWPEGAVCGPERCDGYRGLSSARQVAWDLAGS